MISNIFPVLCIALCSVSCKVPMAQDTLAPGQLSPQAVDFKLPYDLNTPVARWSLPQELLEISALSPAEDNRYLLAVQDEVGVLYWIDKQTGQLARQSDFWKEGDYEGLEMTPDALYAVKSTGTLYRIEQPGSSNQKVEKFNTALNNTTPDIEGLAYDAVGKRLLLACKAPAGAGTSDTLERCIYAFDTESNTLSEKPVFRIRQADVLAWLKAKQGNPAVAKIAEYFSKEKKEPFDLTPSAIGIHPVSGHLYLCSSGGRLLLVLDRQGALIHIAKLDKTMLPQPEGICFDQNGDLFLSSEGKKDQAATLVRFAYRP